MNHLLIIGGGAAGLMAGCMAGESSLPAMILERRHRPGLKLLMCGNNRCNISHDFSAEQMLAAYGGEMADFLRPALTQFPPEKLRGWFGRHNLQTVVKNQRVYPRSENADDVLHCFTDTLRDLTVPLVLNCPAARLVPLRPGEENRWRVECENGMSLEARNVLLCTGGVSYPKTGSVGDGQRIAGELGLKTTELRPGLIGIDHHTRWLTTRENQDIPDVKLTALDKQGRHLASCRGNLLCAGTVLRGSAVFDLMRQLAHLGIQQNFSLELDLLPNEAENKIPSMNLEQLLSQIDLPEEIISNLRREKSQSGARSWRKLPLEIGAIRPLKEAIVTVGGVAREEIDSRTMESLRYPGLYFAGELVDIDGPTGGFNLHLAFATAHLAIRAILADSGLEKTERTVMGQEGPKMREFSGKGIAKSSEKNQAKSPAKNPAKSPAKTRYVQPKMKSWWER